MRRHPLVKTDVFFLVAFILIRHPSIRTLVELAVHGARCILGSVLSQDAAI